MDRNKNINYGPSSLTLGFTIISVIIIVLSVFASLGSCGFFHAEELGGKQTYVDFFFRENFWGKSKRAIVYKNKCFIVPSTYFEEKPHSVWSSDCIMVYSKENCYGHGVRIAGLVPEFRSYGFNRGIKSYKPCERNIQIKFMKSKPANHPNHYY